MTATFSIGKIAEQFGEVGRRVRRRLPQTFGFRYVETPLFEAGDSIGPYKLVRELAAGSFGVAWLANKVTRVTTQFALKLPKLDSTDNVVPADWQNEADRWAKLKRHPNIVPIIEADQFAITSNNVRDPALPRKVFAIVSEFIDGGTVTDWLAKHSGLAPDSNSAVEMICQILDGVSHLHSEGFIHRDIKPGNVFLQGGKPRIGDFGLTRQFDDTLSARWGGSPGYMSPEAFRNERCPQLDLWSVGVMLYEMLHGHRPFVSVRAITSATPVSLDPTIPEAIRDVLRKSLDKTIGNRYATAAEFLAALRSIPQFFPVAIDQASRVTETQLNHATISSQREEHLRRFLEEVSRYRMPTVSDSRYAAKVAADPHGLREIADELCREIATIYDNLLPVYDGNKYLIFDEWARDSLQAVVKRIDLRVRRRLAAMARPNWLVLGEDHKTAALRVAFQRCLGQVITLEMQERRSHSAREFVNLIDELGTAAREEDHDWATSESDDAA